nr:hypothetical protein [Verrucomicrobiales bacterium]
MVKTNVSKKLIYPSALLAGILLISFSGVSQPESERKLPVPGTVIVDNEKQEVILSAKVQF